MKEVKLLNERKRLVCPKCGSGRFRLVADLVISDVMGFEDDIVADRTIEEEVILGLTCLKCGHRLCP